MFHRANKNELRTWMLGDLVLFLLLVLVSIPMFGTFIKDTKKVGYLIFGIIFVACAALCIFYFVKMIQAFRTYEERMEKQAAIEAEEQAQREAEEAERIKLEEEETKKFIEEYQQKVAEAEEQRRIEAEEKEKQEREAARNNGKPRKK